MMKVMISLLLDRAEKEEQGDREGGRRKKKMDGGWMEVGWKREMEA